MNNKRAQASCSLPFASSWNAKGVEAMEHYLEGPIQDLSPYNANYLEDALVYFQNAVDIDPTCHRVLTNLALVYIIKGKRGTDTKAKELLDQAIARAPEQSDYYAIRGFVHELLSNGVSARADWQRALRLNPRIGEGKYLGILLVNDTRDDQRDNFPQVKEYHPPVESNTMRKCLAFVEFSRVSISDYGIVPPLERTEFRRTKYLKLNKMVPPFILSLLQLSYQSLSTLGKIPFGDSQAKRFSLYNDRISVFLHFQLTDKIRQITGHNAVPTYSYYGSYIAGSTLEPHTDRHQCEFTISLSILHRPVHAKPWPLCLGKTPKFERNNSAESRTDEEMPAREDSLCIPLQEGDALLFMGRHLVHYREGTLKEVEDVTSNIFLHWVQDDFDAPLD